MMSSIFFSPFTSPVSVVRCCLVQIFGVVCNNNMADDSDVSMCWVMSGVGQEEECMVHDRYEPLAFVSLSFLVFELKLRALMFVVFHPSSSSSFLSLVIQSVMSALALLFSPLHRNSSSLLFVGKYDLV